ADPLAPVVAMVRFCGGWFGKDSPAGKNIAARPWSIGSSRRGSQGEERELELEARSGLYGIDSQFAIPAQRRGTSRAGGSGARNPRAGFERTPQISSRVLPSLRQVRLTSGPSTDSERFAGSGRDPDRRLSCPAFGAALCRFAD